MKRTLSLVAVGASAGGLDALVKFFHAVPARTEATFLVIQHLSPDHESIMSELLAPHVKLPIEEAKDGGLMSPGTIYLCPPAVIPSVDGMVLRLEAHAKDKSLVLPINLLFASMARTLGPAAAAILSGGSDGGIDGALLTFTDITERIRLEKRFEFALKTAKLSCWDWDLRGGQIIVQSAGHCLLGEDCLRVERGREGWMEVVHPDDRENVRHSLEACLRGETEEWNCEHRFLTSSGQWLWVSNQGVVSHRSPEGEALEMIGTTRDISDYKLAFMEVSCQRDVLTLAGDIAQMGYWDYDPETQQVEWSSQTRKILGVDDDFDASVEGTFSFILPSSRERLREAFEQAVSEGVPYDLELQCVNNNGRHCVVRSSGRPQFDAKDKVVRVVGIFQEVTELFRIERERSAIFELSPDFLATVKFDGRFNSFNTAWKKLLGYSANDLERMSLCEIIVLEDRADFQEILKQVIAGKTVTNRETRVLSKENRDASCQSQTRWLSWSLSSDPDLKFIVVSARDVTDQKEAYQALQEARIRAEEANRAKTDFLAVMSHELRTPLNPILGYADMLVEEVENEEHKEILRTISQSGDHMLSLIEELLQYSKLDAGKTRVEPVDFLLSDMISEKVHLMSGMLKGKACELNYSLDWGPLDESASPILRGDVGMLRQILRNLIANAIKFTEKGRVDFNVRVLEASEGKALVEFAVADTGIGITEEDMGKLFEPFYQVDGGMTRKYEGTGLGLAICQRLTELMDGEISVQSEVGKGSVFTLKLPFDYRDEADTKSAEKRAKTVHERSTQTTSHALQGDVLVVEDNASNAYYIEKLIELRGARPEIATSGESALEMLSERDYHLILLDLHMPGIGGLETLKRIRALEAKADRPPVPVIVLTADASKTAKKDSQEAGADGLLTKPVRPAAINEILSRYLPRV